MLGWSGGGAGAAALLPEPCCGYSNYLIEGRYSNHQDILQPGVLIMSMLLTTALLALVWAFALIRRLTGLLAFMSCLMIAGPKGLHRAAGQKAHISVDDSQAH